MSHCLILVLDKFLETLWACTIGELENKLIQGGGLHNVLLLYSEQRIQTERIVRILEVISRKISFERFKTILPQPSVLLPCGSLIYSYFFKAMNVKVGLIRISYFLGADPVEPCERECRKRMKHMSVTRDYLRVVSVVSKLVVIRARPLKPYYWLPLELLKLVKGMLAPRFVPIRIRLNKELFV